MSIYELTFRLVGVLSLQILIAYALLWACEHISPDADVFGAIADEAQRITDEGMGPKEDN